MFGFSSNPDFSLKEVTPNLSAADYSLLDKKLIVHVGVSELVPIMDKSLQNAQVETDVRTGDPRTNLYDILPRKKIHNAAVQMIVRRR